VIPICCAHISHTTRGETRIGFEVTLKSPNDDQQDHHEVYTKFFDVADMVTALTLALQGHALDAAPSTGVV
jgi:hypothetical protein